MRNGPFVRLTRTAHETLKQLARQSGRSMQSELEHAIEFYRRQQFLKDANDAFAALQQDSAAWAEEQTECRIWDTTLEDDLQEE